MDERWRGEIEARVSALEHQRDLVSTLDRSVTRLQGDVQGVREDIRDGRREISAIAAKIDTSREDTVKDLKIALASRDTSDATWKLTKFQATVAAIVALIVMAIPILIQLAAGH